MKQIKNNSRQNIFKQQMQGINIRDLEKLENALRKIMDWSQVFKERWRATEGFLDVTRWSRPLRLIQQNRL